MQTEFSRLGLALKWILLVLALGTCFDAQAQQGWPNHPIRILVPTAPGGSTDMISRMLGQKLSESLGQPVVIENRSGAGGNIAATYLATSAPDDHLFLVVTMPMLAINQYLYRKLDFDPDVDLKPVGLIGGTPNVIVASPSLNVHTLKELAEYGRAHPNTLAYSSAAVGSTGHLLNELFKANVRIDLLHVPYRGNGPALTALLAGDVQFMNDNVAVLLPQIRAGKVQPLAVTSPKRLAELPDVPTVGEAGYPNMTMAGWWGLVAQSKVQPEVIARMNRELVAILEKPDFIALLRDNSIEGYPGTPENMNATVGRDRERWKKVIDISGAKMD